MLDTLLREDYGGLASRMTRTKDGVRLALPSGRRVRLAPGRLYQDFVVAPDESLTLDEVVEALTRVAAPGDAAGVAAFAEECHAALRAYDLHETHRPDVLTRLRHALRTPTSPPPWEKSAQTGHPSSAPVEDAEDRESESKSESGPGGGVRLGRTVAYETLGAFVDHPVYPTSRARLGLSEEEVAAYAPEFAPHFALRWAAVPIERVTMHGDLPGWWPSAGTPHMRPEDPLLRPDKEPWHVRPEALPLRPDRDPSHVRFPVHPLTLPAVRRIPGVSVLDEPYLVVRPTLSMRTVEVDARTHLKLPLATSTLGARNRRSIKPGTLADGARAELLLREVLRREPDLDVVLADEQTYAHAGHEYLGWMVRRLPPGEIVPVAALLAPYPVPGGGPRVLDDLAARHRGGDVAALLADYLRVLLTWNVRLFVTYGIALEAHQQNLALIFDESRSGSGARMRLLVKDDDGLLASPDRLVAAGLAVPGFADPRLLTGDPHALADVFVTITLHLAAAAIAFGAGHGELVAGALESALAEHDGHPMARLLRARTLDAARLVGKSMVSAGTLVDRSRIASADINKHYGTSGPNYLRRTPRREANH
ncbi:IucA/IucC family protein [Sphaerisporangium perillae]|uniref:IucA/IucC family protein n=1 Tax=Sphaerisporangium perillae TaxID=2935860 RepID=UPI00200C9D2F|nr:IucA/IucC family protein [Sphaerisporangium perillae]